MSKRTSDVSKVVALTILSEWISILALIFGGCCSNALALEQLTTDHPHSGNLITFAQFVVITLVFLPCFVVLRRSPIPYPALRERRVPLAPYALQVVLFAAVSLLNNAAFAYAIPMSVHIIFRSGGLISSLLMNWLALGRRYNVIQIASVAVVSLGVVLTTLSAVAPTQSGPGSLKTGTDPSLYATGVGLLSLALFLGGLLGVVQDRTYAKYGRDGARMGAAARSRDAPEANRRARDTSGVKTEEKTYEDAPGPRSGRQDVPPPWQEALFYLHFLSIPLFLFMWKDIWAQFQALGAGPQYILRFPDAVHRVVTAALPSFAYSANRELMVPRAYIPLLLNTLTQLLCVAGVHRLTARVSSLTVTLILVVRKAVSLLISVSLLRAGGRGAASGRDVLMWAGAMLVFAGTVGYSMGSGQGQGRSRTGSDKTKKE